MRILVALLLVATVLAGCADSDVPEVTDEDAAPILDTPSAAIFDILPAIEEWLPMSDGKAMHNAVFRPDTDEPVPVFINFSPYWGDTAELGGDAFSQYMIEEYVPRGYAVVLAALRGTGHSQGCFQIGGDRELMDMHEVVDHYASVDWSNGNIATGGKSYDSSPTNGLIAKYPHPALKGVFHVSGITDMYAYNYKGGVPYTTGPVFNTYYYLQGTDEYGVSLVGAGSPMDEDADSLARVIDDAACAEMPSIQAHGVGSGVTGMKTDYWIERDWTRHIGDSDWEGSIFFIHGLQDWNVKPDHILPWITELPEQIRVKGWLHQSGHVYPERTDWNATMLAWLDAELKGHQNDFWDGPQWDVRSDDGTWFRHDAWPPALQEVEMKNGVELFATTVDRTFLDIENTTHISGSVRLNLSVSYTRPDNVVTAAMYEITSGGLRTWVSEGILRPIYREGLDAPVVDTLGFFPMTIDLYPADHIFAAGSRVEIVFQEEPTRGALVLPRQMENVSISVDEILWPIANATLLDPQPADMRCFAC